MLSTGQARSGRATAWALFALLAFGVRAPAAAAAAPPLRDDLGRELHLEHAPSRIVSLLPSITETVCALEACDRLVATDRFSNWPAAVRTLPKVGGLDDAAFELIARLHPDLVLLSRTQRITGRLESLGLTSFALDTETYAAISRTVNRLGAILGEPERAAALERRIEQQVAELAAQARAARSGPPLTVYFEVDRTPYAAGAASFIGELLERLGTRNIVTADLGPFPKINPEYVVREDPDVIMMSSPDAPDASQLAERPGWQTIRAVRERHVCRFGEDERDLIVRPGPRVALGMRALEACLERVAPAARSVAR